MIRKIFKISAKVLVIIITIAVIALLNILTNFKNFNVAGESGETTSSVNTGNQWSAMYSSYAGWTSCVHQDQSEQEGESQARYEYRCGAHGWRIVTDIMRFPTSGLPDINEISSMYVRMKIHSMESYGEPEFPAPWLSLVLTQNETPGQAIIQPNMHDTWIDVISPQRVSNWYNWNDYEAGDYLDFHILDSHIQDVLDGSGDYSGTYTYLQVVSQYQFNDVAPGVYENGDGYVWELGDMTPALYYTYAAEPDRADFDYGVNSGYNPAPTGDEVADNITLRTISCMYADEDIGFTVHGESGAVISLSLVNQNGTVLESIEDEVQTNDCYYWQIDTLPSDYTGMVRARESNFNLASPWVAVQPSFDSTQANLKTYSRYTEYPQYENMFSEYVVYRGDYMYVHWKTNIDGSSESDNHRLDLYINGDNVTPAYSENFTYLGENYYKGEADNWQDGINWRFAVFTPQSVSGTRLYGELVIDLDRDYVPANKGFIQPVIYKISTDSELGETHTAYWYLEDAGDGINITLQNDSVEVDDRINVKIVVGRQCNASDYLSNALIEVVGYNQVYGTIEDGTNWFSLDGIEVEGDYDVRVSLSDDSLHTYSYIYQLPLTVAGEGALLPDDTGPSGIWEAFLNFIGAHNLDSDVGHWIVVILVMVLLFLISYKSSILRVALPLLVLGAAFVANWIDQWLIVLLALGAGLTLWGIFRRKASGGGENEG